MIIWLLHMLIFSSFFLRPGTSNNLYNKTYNDYRGARVAQTVQCLTTDG
jgi:hypothetical protein